MGGLLRSFAVYDVAVVEATILLLLFPHTVYPYIYSHIHHIPFHDAANPEREGPPPPPPPPLSVGIHQLNLPGQARKGGRRGAM